jgi:hypothetical protein
MHRILLPALFALAAAPVAAQGIVVQVRCQGECPAGPRRPMPLDSVDAWANLAHGQAMTYVNHVFRNGTAGTVDGALFFPLPAGATLYSVSVVDAALPAHDGSALLQYNEWSGPVESGWILDGLDREQPELGLRAYAGAPVVHVPLRAIPPRGIRHVQISYMQLLRPEEGAITYRYPLSTGAGASPIGHLTFGMTVTSEHGFHDLRSPSHAVDVAWGTESAPCPARMRCGTRGVTSQRVKVVRLQDGADARARDLAVVFTLAGEADATAFAPGRP